MGVCLADVVNYLSMVPNSLHKVCELVYGV